MALTSLSDVKVWLEIADSSRDAKLTTLIASVEKMIARECDRVFEQDTYTEVLDGKSQNRLVLHNYPVTSITSVHVSADRSFTSEYLIDPSEYSTDDKLLEQGILQRHDQVWALGSSNVQVVYAAGFATIPEDLSLAALILVEWYWRGNNDRRIGRSSIGKNGETTSYIQTWPIEVTPIIESYKRQDFWAGSRSWGTR